MAPILFRRTGLIRPATYVRYCFISRGLIEGESMPARKKRSLSKEVHVVSSIREIRGQRVILDADLAVIYGVTTKRLNEQIRRNSDRFPEDFMFRLTWDEAEAMRSQFATAWPRRCWQSFPCLRSQFVTA